MPKKPEKPERPENTSTATSTTSKDKKQIKSVEGDRDVALKSRVKRPCVNDSCPCSVDDDC